MFKSSTHVDNFSVVLDAFLDDTKRRLAAKRKNSLSGSVDLSYRHRH
jgi:hypothetical protein